MTTIPEVLTDTHRAYLDGKRDGYAAGLRDGVAALLELAAAEVEVELAEEGAVSDIVRDFFDDLAARQYEEAMRLVTAFDALPEAARRIIVRPHPTNPKHVRRCPVCSPWANPGRLAVDGHEYARRRRKR